MNDRPAILVIDDTPANLRTLAAALAERYDVQFALSGAQGLALAAESVPDLVLLDVLMPDLDGYEVCRRFKADPRLRDVPLVFVTALADVGEESAGLGMGAADYLTKPINVSIARLRIDNLLAREALRAQVERQRNELEVRLRELTGVQQRLVRQEARLRILLERTQDGVVVIDRDGRAVEWNPAFVELLGYPEEALRDMNVRDWDVGLGPQEIERVLREAEQGHARLETRHRRRDGTLRDVEISISGVDWDGRPHFFGLHRDITARKQAEAAQRLAATVFSHAREGILITDAAAVILEVNQTFCEITGYRREEVIGRKPSLLKSGRQPPAFYARLWQRLTADGHWAGELWNRRKNGEIYPEALTISAVRDPQGETQQYVALFSDITQSKRHERRLEHLAHSDALTKLPNRLLLADRLRQAMAQVPRRASCLAVCFIDIDGFKAVNDRHGHDVGDQLLTVLAARMKLALRGSDTLARIGGDEFVALLPDQTDEDASCVTVMRLIRAASRPVRVGGVEVAVSASAGVAFYRGDAAVDGEQLLAQADQAMYQAKQAGKNGYCVFRPETPPDAPGPAEG